PTQPNHHTSLVGTKPLKPVAGKHARCNGRCGFLVDQSPFLVHSTRHKNNPPQGRLRPTVKNDVGPRPTGHDVGRHHGFSLWPGRDVPTPPNTYSGKEDAIESEPNLLSAERVTTVAGKDSP
ncbi:unnamed protein product, partial [Ectocarpus sp. 12 AP-2014]